MARDFTDFKGLLDPAHQVAILLPSNPSYDAVAAALSLKLSFDQAGHTTTVSCPDPMTVEFHRLVGLDTISNSFGSRNLVITFPDQTEIVDKVSYNVEAGLLQLIITPKPNTPGIDYKKLKFVSGSGPVDLLILIGNAQVPSSYSQLTPKYSLSDPLLSQTVTYLLNSLNLPFNSDIASNLFSALQRSTDNYQSDIVSADIFEAAAILLRKGARRHDPANPTDYPDGSIPMTQSNNQVTNNQPIETPQSDEDWYEPKVYKGTSLS